MRTIILKLHKPSKTKQNIIDEAIINYNKAFQYLMEKAFIDIGTIEKNIYGEKGAYKAAFVSKWVGKELSAELNQFEVQPFKDSLKLDFGMTLAGYLQHISHQPKASYPVLCSSINLPDSLSVTQKLDKLRPIYFCRYDTKRSFCFLYDKINNRFYLKVYLMNHSHAKPTVEYQNSTNRLRYVHHDSNFLETRKSKGTFLIVPLSFGKYQEQYLNKAVGEPGILRTAKLYKKGADYYLAVSIDTGEVQIQKTKTFLGVTRGLKYRLNYSVVDLEGKVLASGSIADQRNNPEESSLKLDQLHKAANHIVALAVQYKSQVILQNLTEKGDYLSWRSNDDELYPAYKCHEYNQLTRILEYKLPEQGLPLAIKVSSVDIFYRCHECGYLSRQNRLSKERFLCTKCGATMNIDQLGSLNLAIKLINYHSSKLQIKVVRSPEGVTFTNKVLGLFFFMSYQDYQPGRITDEIQRSLEVLRSKLKELKGNEYNQTASILKKFEQYENPLDLIDFI